MLCPCGSGKHYQDCCQLYHEGVRYPETALELMKSRYSAYAKSKVDYIIATTHPENSSYRLNRAIWRKEIGDFCTHTNFEKLEIVDFEEGEISFVTFIARLSQRGRDVSFQEKSRFEKKDGKWLYLSGTIMVV